MSSTLLTISQFRSEWLDNERGIYVYLPTGYTADEHTSYPVLYLHDGQGLFQPGFNGQSWHLHRTVDRLIACGAIGKIIMIGICNKGEERASEFTHALPGILHEQDKVEITPRGQLYERFLIEELKPFIDKTFRTKRDAANTALMGSSRGGTVTYHIGMRRADVFGKLGILSPYLYYVNPANLTEYRMYADIMAMNVAPLQATPEKIWIDLGGREGLLIMEKHVKGLVKELVAAGFVPDHQLAYYFDPEATHTESDWERRSELPLLHMFGAHGRLLGVTLKETSANFLQDGKGRLIPEARFEGGRRLTPLGGQFMLCDESVPVNQEGVVRADKTGSLRLRYRFEGQEAEYMW